MIHRRTKRTVQTNKTSNSQVCKTFSSSTVRSRTHLQRSPMPKEERANPIVHQTLVILNLVVIVNRAIDTNVVAHGALLSDSSTAYRKKQCSALLTRSADSLKKNYISCIHSTRASPFRRGKQTSSIMSTFCVVSLSVQNFFVVLAVSC